MWVVEFSGGFLSWSRTFNIYLYISWLIKWQNEPTTILMTLVILSKTHLVWSSYFFVHELQSLNFRLLRQDTLTDQTFGKISIKKKEKSVAATYKDTCNNAWASCALNTKIDKKNW